ncbi:MAG: hypothetical protein ACREJD_09045 [Phycisphaerales bacterium]
MRQPTTRIANSTAGSPQDIARIRPQIFQRGTCCPSIMTASVGLPAKLERVFVSANATAVFQGGEFVAAAGKPSDSDAITIRQKRSSLMVSTE